MARSFTSIPQSENKPTQGGQTYLSEGAPALTTAVIRAGVSDMMLAGAPDSELARRVARLSRRGR